MDKTKTFTITKDYAKKLKEKDAKMSPAKRLQVSKAMVQANSEANTPRKTTKNKKKV